MVVSKTKQGQHTDPAMEMQQDIIRLCVKSKACKPCLEAPTIPGPWICS